LDTLYFNLGQQTWECKLDYAEALTLLTASHTSYLKSVLRNDLDSAAQESANILWIAGKLFEATKLMREKNER